MNKFKALKSYKIERKELKHINGGIGETKKYSCVVKTKGFKDHKWTCYAPQVSQCKNPIGLGKQTCKQVNSITPAE